MTCGDQSNMTGGKQWNTAVYTFYTFQLYTFKRDYGGKQSNLTGGK